MMKYKIIYRRDNSMGEPAADLVTLDGSIVTSVYAAAGVPWPEVKRRLLEKARITLKFPPPEPEEIELPENKEPE